jgi:hypothetical protein
MSGCFGNLFNGKQFSFSAKRWPTPKEDLCLMVIVAYRRLPTRLAKLFQSALRRR